HRTSQPTRYTERQTHYIQQCRDPILGTISGPLSRPVDFATADVHQDGARNTVTRSPQNG
ncbi:MAG: hypothetical protein WBF57_24360, partial [Mycobacterium sp.]